MAQRILINGSDFGPDVTVDLKNLTATSVLPGKITAQTTQSGVIADPASPSLTYVQAEMVAIRNAVVAIIDALQSAGIVANS